MSSSIRHTSPQRVLDLHATMCRIRAFERMVVRGNEEGLVKGAAHLSIGQEGVAAGICGNLRTSDMITSNHRGHGHTIAKGADPEAMMRELFGREGGVCQGKGGSMHIADFSVGMLGANGIVGAGILIAVGAAKSKKLLGTRDVVVCFFGDGAVNRGPFLEGLNWARVYDLPVLFVCEDNRYAATTRTADLTGGPGPVARAESLGIPAHRTDGNDVIDVDGLAGRLIEQIRDGRGPLFLHAETYRHLGHTLADPGAYRPAAEVEAAMERDPIVRNREWLRKSGVAATTLDGIAADAEAEMTAAFEAAKAAPWPDLQFAATDVQDIGGPA